MQISDLVLYKNNQLIAFNKPGAMPTQADKSQDTSLMNLAEIYAKSEVFPIHRIDRPASGVVLVAKNKKSVAHLNQQLRERKITKTYLAVVQQLPKKNTGILKNYLQKGKGNKMYVTDTPNATSKEAILRYEVLGSSDRYHLLKIKLETGRQHQIRVQLAAAGSPIKGDVKYGARRKNKDRSIHLHSWKIAFRHPVSGEQEEITAPLPKENLWTAMSEFL